MLVCYFFMPAPPAPHHLSGPPVNINYVYGFSDAAPQSWINPNLYFALLMIALPLLVYVPTHWILRKCMKPA